MASAVEAAQAKGPLASTLAAGVDTLSLGGIVTFTQYLRLVLPIDGFVFWVKADLLSPSAILNASSINTVPIDQDSSVITAAPTVSVKGSLHYSTQQNQNEAETEANNTVIFTAESPIQQFNDLKPNVLWIGTYGGDRENYDGPITFAFSSRGRYYKEADLFHYVGVAVLPAFEYQLINKLDDIAARGLIVSNSLPIWLNLANYTPPYANGISSCLPLYPSFLVPDNLLPPYGVIHIFPESTISLQAAPLFDPTLGQSSLCQDRVRVTLYGMTNEAALLWLSAALQYSADYNTIGIMNLPAVRDEKRTQAELLVIAQKKTIEFDVSYNQSTSRQVARQMLTDIIPSYLPQPLTAVGFQSPYPHLPQRNEPWLLP